MQVTGLPPTLLPEKEKATEIPLPDVGAGAAPVPVPVGGPEHEPQFQLETFLDTSAKFHPSTFTRLPSAYFGRGIALLGIFSLLPFLPCERRKQLIFINPGGALRLKLEPFILHRHLIEYSLQTTFRRYPFPVFVEG